MARQRSPQDRPRDRARAHGPRPVRIRVRADDDPGHRPAHGPRRRPLVLELHHGDGRLRRHLQASLRRGHGLLRHGHGPRLGHRAGARALAHGGLRLQGALCRRCRHRRGRPRALLVRRRPPRRRAQEEARPAHDHQPRQPAGVGDHARVHVHLRRARELRGHLRLRERPAVGVHLLSRHVRHAPSRPRDARQARRREGRGHLRLHLQRRDARRLPAARVRAQRRDVRAVRRARRLCVRRARALAPVHGRPHLDRRDARLGQLHLPLWL